MTVIPVRIDDPTLKRLKRRWAAETAKAKPKPSFEHWLALALRSIIKK